MPIDPRTIPAAILIVGDSRYAQSLERQAGGTYRGVKYFRVNTSIMGEVYLAMGLPPEGAVFDDSPAGARTFLVGHSVVYDTGHTAPGARVGWSIVRCEYQSPGWGGRVEPRPKIGGHWTEFETSTDSITIMFDALGNGPINNGDGASKPVGRIGLKVHIYKTIAQVQNYPWWLVKEAAREQALNLEPLTLPPAWQHVPLPTIEWHELRYTGLASCSLTGDLFEIVHALEWSDNFDVVWQKVRADGTAGGVGSAQPNIALDLRPLFG